MKKFILIVAGGKGLRMGGDLPKQFIPFEGKPVLMHTLEAFRRWDASARLVVVLPASDQAYWEMLCREIGSPAPHRLATGGETRFDSVRSGLTVVEEETREAPENEEILVGVHDGVRPFVPAEVVEACFQEAARSGAAVPVVPMIDSLREGDAERSRPVDRNRYFAVQTPQVFSLALLREAYRQPFSPQFTDDASVVEARGAKVKMVAGSRENIKLTTPFDLLLAEAMFRSKTSLA